MMGVNNLDIDTPLFTDMYISTKYLNCSHSEFLELPKLEKKKLRLYFRVYFLKKKKISDGFERERSEKSLLANAPKVRS